MQLLQGIFLSHVILRRLHSEQLKPSRFLRAFALAALSSPSAESAGEPSPSGPAPEAEPAAERERFLEEWGWVVEGMGEGWVEVARSVWGEWVDELGW